MVLARFESCQLSLQTATRRDQTRIRTDEKYLRLSAEAGYSNSRIRRQIGKRRRVISYQRIPGIRSPWYRTDCKAGGFFQRHIHQAVTGQVDSTFQQSRLQLLNERFSSTGLRQWSGEFPLSLCYYRNNIHFDIRPRCFQQAGNCPCSPPR